MAKPVVGILMGSDSDLDVMREASKVLDEFGVPFEMTVASAHRSPKRTSDYARSAERRGIKVIIAGAGWAAHLAGVVAAETCVPVIGVPIGSSTLGGIDALLSTVQMPAGVPVASMGIGAGGAKNAGLFVVQMLAIKDKKLKDKLKRYKKRLAAGVEKKAAALKV